MGRPSKALEEGGPWREEGGAVHQLGRGHVCILTTHKIIPVYLIACESCLNLPPPGMSFPICPCMCGSNMTLSAESSLIPSLFDLASPERCNHDWRHMPRTREQFHHGGEKSMASGRQLTSLGLSGYNLESEDNNTVLSYFPQRQIMRQGFGWSIKEMMAVNLQEDRWGRGAGQSVFTDRLPLRVPGAKAHWRLSESVWNILTIIARKLQDFLCKLPCLAGWGMLHGHCLHSISSHSWPETTIKQVTSNARVSSLAEQLACTRTVYQRLMMWANNKQLLYNYLLCRVSVIICAKELAPCLPHRIMRSEINNN